MGALEGAVQWFYERVRPEMVTEADAGAAGFLAALAFRLVNLGIASLGGGYYLTSRGELAEAIEQSVPPSPAVSLPSVET
jgi:hypothetical protein